MHSRSTISTRTRSQLDKRGADSGARCFFCGKLWQKTTGDYNFGPLRPLPDDPDRKVYLHYNCVRYLPDVRINGNKLSYYRASLLQSESLRCSICNQRRGAIPCRAPGCEKTFHYDCGAKNQGAFDNKRHRFFCGQHAHECLNEADLERPENDKLYNVERVLDKRVERGEVRYLVKWEGYPISEATWEPANNFLNPFQIERYERRQHRIETAKARGNVVSSSSDSDEDDDIPVVHLSAAEHDNDASDDELEHPVVEAHAADGAPMVENDMVRLNSPDPDAQSLHLSTAGSQCRLEAPAVLSSASVPPLTEGDNHTVHQHQSLISPSQQTEKRMQLPIDCTHSATSSPSGPDAKHVTEIPTTLTLDKIIRSSAAPSASTLAQSLSLLAAESASTDAASSVPSFDKIPRVSAETPHHHKRHHASINKQHDTTSQKDVGS